jgi:hypothetical protein
VLQDSDSLNTALSGHPEAHSWSAQEVERLVETVRWGGLPRLTEAVNNGLDARTAIETTGAAIAGDRSSSDVAGTRWALAALAFAAGHLPDSEVVYWTPGPRRSKKTPLIIAAAAVAVLALIGGGLWWALSGDDEGYDERAYCDAYNEADATFSGTDFAQLDGQAFEDLQQQVAEIKELAPPEVKDEWETLDGALTDFEELLAGAGLTFDDLGGMAQGEIPENADLGKLQELIPKLQEFAQRSDFQTAGDAVDKDAQTRCN